jgi:energy-coupling factor transporter ATP-binding protein EcfA2
LEVSSLSVTLGKQRILRDLGFAAEGGSVIAIVGRNGVGKTTLLRALAGLQTHTGTAAIDGDQPDLGLVFQNPDLQLFNPTVREEILYRLPEPDMMHYKWLIQVLGLVPYEHCRPLLLSEGEKKRVALATVLMRRPQHGILLDEPSLGQDEHHKAMLVHLCRALAEAGLLVILTTHDLGLAAQSDRLLLLGPDGFVADGPPTDVMRDGTAWTSIELPIPSPDRVRRPEVSRKLEVCT